MVAEGVPSTRAKSYTEALEHGLSGEERHDECPYDRASLWGKISYQFALELLRLGYERPLQLQDLPPLRGEDRAQDVAHRLEANWLALGDKRTAWKRPLWWALYATFKPAIHMSAFYTMGESATMIVQPILIGYFIEWMLGDGPLWQGILLGLGLVLASFLQAVVHHILYYTTMKGGWNSRIAFTGLLHNKLLRLHSSYTTHVSSGFVINLIATDVMRFDQASTSLHFGWMAVIDLIIIALLICYHVGYRAGLAGIAVIMSAMGINMRFSKEIFRHRRRVTDFTSSRTNIITEVLKSMLSVKAFGWEKPFSQKVDTERRKEAWHIRVVQFMKAVNASLFTVAPMLASFTTFAVYSRLGNELKLGRVLTVLALYQVLRTVVGKKFVRFVENYPELHAALFRFQSFLRLPEFNRPEIPATGTPGVLVLTDATFRWALPRFDVAKTDPSTSVVGLEELQPDQQSDIALHNVTLSVKPGELVVVAGEVGSGKSALLLAILGELPLVSGTMRNESARVAYASQTPWIKAGTLRDNIIFGGPFSQVWYDTVIEACCLRVDIASFADGEQTEIGARGINLSGGQKARIALARAVYSQAPLVLLDDPLSAVDPHVARSLYDNVILGLLRDKSVILVTHHPHFMRDGTTVHVLGHGGVPVASGPWESIQSHVNQLQEDLEQADEATPAPTPPVANGGADPPSEEKKDALKEAQPSAHSVDELQASEVTSKRRATALVLPEDRVLGVVSFSTYLAYMAAGGGLASTMVLALFVCAQGLLISVDYQLERWASSPPEDQDNDTFVELYGILAGVAAAAALCRSVLYYTTTLTAASTLHNRAFTRVLHAPMAFFTSNPLGRVINRFSSDQGQADTLLPDSLFETLSLMSVAGGSIVFACIAIPYLAIALPPLVLYLRNVREFATRSLRELKRLDGTTRSPVKSSFFASIQGLVAIRAFHGEEVSQQTFLHALDLNAHAWYWWLIGNRWIGFRLDMMCTMLLIVAVILAIALRRELDPGMLGLAFVYVNSLSGLFQFMVRQSALVETYMTSVERLNYYGKKIAIEHDSQGQGKSTDLDSWPLNGEVVVDNLHARYREDLPEILHGLTFTATSGSKVGIVGRTGAGKSSLVQALFRLNEVTTGTVTIGGVDTSSIPLQLLRSRIGLIPQEAELFDGTIRDNIDPFEAYSEDELRAVLDEVNLSNVDLGMRVAEGGSNLSAGQKQLVSLARAMIRKPKVVVIDEATANVDYGTDKIIQTSLRDSVWFRGATRLIVAHRMHTIEDSDTILVFDQGEVAESGPPKVLQETNGIFAEMLQASSSDVLDQS